MIHWSPCWLVDWVVSQKYIHILSESEIQRGTAVGRMQDSPSDVTYGIWDASRHNSKWGSIGLKFAAVNSAQNGWTLLGVWHLRSERGVHWPPRWLHKCFKCAASISLIMNEFCSLCHNRFFSISMSIANRNACAPNAADYLVSGLFAQWFLFCIKNSWRCLIWMLPFLRLSAVVVQIWRRCSTTLFNGNLYVVDVIQSTTVSLQLHSTE